jgi:hypothetical protein
VARAGEAPDGAPLAGGEAAELMGDDRRIDIGPALDLDDALLDRLAQDALEDLGVVGEEDDLSHGAQHRQGV